MTAPAPAPGADTGAAAPVRPWRRRALAFAVAAVAIAVALLAWAGSAQQPRLTSVSPADGARLAPGATEVTLTFNAPPKVGQVHVDVVGPGVATRSPRPAVRGATIVLPVVTTLAGEYRAGYHVELTDGREYSGTTRFTVSTTGALGPGRSAAPPAAGGHAHADRDPASLAILLLDALLIGVVVVLMVRGPRRS